jgi:DNA-3-methyladenine glycosylase II
MARLLTQGDLEAAVGMLIKLEPRFALIVARYGLPSLRQTDPGLRSLLRIVTDQLISLKAGQAIWNRLATKLEPFEPQSVLACPAADLRAMGLSGAKANAFHAAARAFRTGPLADGLLCVMPDGEIMKKLLEIPGIGPWTANIYLMSAVGSADAWPAADLALRRAAMDLLSLSVLPGDREMARVGAFWRPHRSTAALLLWSHYRGLKRLPQT